jgi:uncharacterized membrane protein YecN with MAPEG domain
MDGGDQTLLRRMRAHANYTETVPIVLLEMAAAEWSHAPPWLLWAGGLCLLAGRAMHAAILILKGWGLPRAIGMILTFVPMASFGGWCVFNLFPAVEACHSSPKVDWEPVSAHSQRSPNG